MKRFMKKREKKEKKGFTLLEILIVVAIIGLIASLIVPNLIGRFEKSKEEIAKAQIEMLSSAIEAFKLDVGRYPNTLDELINCNDPNWRGPYLAKRHTKGSMGKGLRIQISRRTWTLRFILSWS